jgi:hypothetical protein
LQKLLCGFAGHHCNLRRRLCGRRDEHQSLKD